jgi:hypothetical protein
MYAEVPRGRNEVFAIVAVAEVMIALPTELPDIVNF